MILSVSLDDDALHRVLEITDAGQRNLRTPPAQAIAVMVRNLGAMDSDPSEVVLTGAMAIWTCLAVFHATGPQKGNPPQDPHSREMRIDRRIAVCCTDPIAMES